LQEKLRLTISSSELTLTGGVITVPDILRDEKEKEPLYLSIPDDSSNCRSTTFLDIEVNDTSTTTAVRFLLSWPLDVLFFLSVSALTFDFNCNQMDDIAKGILQRASALGVDIKLTARTTTSLSKDLAVFADANVRDAPSSSSPTAIIDRFHFGRNPTWWSSDGTEPTGP